MTRPADTSRPWQSLIVTLQENATELDLEVLASALFDAGASGVETQDAKSPIRLVAAFAPEFDGASVVESIRDEAMNRSWPIAALDVEAVRPADWAVEWRQHFGIQRFGSVWVVPSWLMPPVDATHVLTLDPGMAFGTGQHETTHLCMERVVELAPSRAVLDVGTGTGILALAALVVGATRAVGIDNDPEALVVAKENAQKNGLEHRVAWGASLADAHEPPFDVVVANILMGPLIELAPEIARVTRPGGHVLLSGILTTQAQQTAAAYAREGLVVVSMRDRGEWALVELVLGAEALS